MLSASLLHRTNTSIMMASCPLTGSQQVFRHARQGPGRRTACISAQAAQRSQDACSGQHPDRRHLLQMLATVPAALAAAPAHSAAVEAPSLTHYLDETDEFAIDLPADWLTGEGKAAGAKFGGASGSRRALAWYPENNMASTNISLIITNIGADFTKLGSFGTASGFGENLVASMDRKFMRRTSKTPVQEARLISAKEGQAGSNKLYYIDYAVRRPEDTEERMFVSAVSLGFNGRYNRLYTLTAQSLASDFATYEPVLRRVVSSFVPPTPVA